MAKLAVARQDEVFITKGADDAQARAIQRRAKAGELTRIAEGVYLKERHPKAQAAIVLRNWHRILGALAPGAVVSHRSAYSGGPSGDGKVFLTHPTIFNRTIKLPGVNAVMVKGPGRLAGDMPFAGHSLYLASQQRQLLENLTPRRGVKGRSAGAEAVEERLVAILNASGQEQLHRLRNDAKTIATPLGLKGQLRKLDQIVGALLATHARDVLKTRAGKLLAKGTPVDAERMSRFEMLASRLRSHPVPHRQATAMTDPARSNFAFLEAYFSNFVEGTEFEIEEARDIALKGHIVQKRPKDSHDVLRVFELALKSPWRDTVPAFGNDFPDGLAQRHQLMLAQRPESNPGAFKLRRNRAGNTIFVEPPLVRGTLIEGSNVARTIPDGLARAIYYAFLVSEVHPFDAGNGRLSRLVMNAELSRVGEARIIIPTIFHEEYVDCQRQLSRQDDPGGHVRALTLMQRWTISLDFADVDKLIELVKGTNALERSRSRYRLSMPDGSRLRGNG